MISSRSRTSHPCLAKAEEDDGDVLLIILKVNQFSFRILESVREMLDIDLHQAEKGGEGCGFLVFGAMNAATAFMNDTKLEQAVHMLVDYPFWTGRHSPQSSPDHCFHTLKL